MSSADLSVFSFFVKPMYPIAPEMDIYVLLGYSFTDASHSVNPISFDEGAFSWGAGVSYDVTGEIAIFAEYTQFYNDTLNGFDHVVDGFNVGINYKF
ncbi:MAG: outer membrane beta-barrel protein [Sulfurovum sp.]|nr:outer membrane beta-barrel protein [Sulfurovum sp.]